jgi:peptide/nickel transport system substrate-binding protein
MQHRPHVGTVGWIVVLILVVLVVGCTTGPRATSNGGPAPERPAPVTRITAATATEPSSIRSQLSRSSAGSVPGSQEIEQLVHSGFAIGDGEGKLQPQIAERVPSLENGRWQISADGQMLTTWTIRAGATWHDGAPVTGDDFVFTADVARDRALPIFRHAAFDWVDTVRAPDPRTVEVTWRGPWIYADTLFSAARDLPILPMPKHLLAGAYLEGKDAFLDHRYWTDDFVGTGPYQLKEWVRGSHLVLGANAQYVLGAPKIEVIEVRFIRDGASLVANLLADSVDLPLGRGISFDEGVQLRERWRGGVVEFTPSSSPKVWPQFINPRPLIVADARFRRALLHAINRQEMADSLMDGLSSVAHSTLVPGTSEFEQLDPSVIRYAYDPRGAAELITGLGYSRGGDGIYRDAQGHELRVEIRSTQIDTLRKSILSVADYWQQIGVATDPFVIPPHLRDDREFYATYPAFDTTRSNNGMDDVLGFHSSQVKTPATQYAGSNRSGYANPELDSLIDRVFVTIDGQERTKLGQQVIRHLTDQVVTLPLFYDVESTAVGNRLAHVSLRVARSSAVTWNAHEWSVRS